jgi:hypothetical protein
MMKGSVRGWGALGHEFTITASMPDIEAHIAELFADLRVAEGDQFREYRLEGPDAAGRWVARSDGEVIGSPGPPSAAFALLLWGINRGVIGAADEGVVLHAGGVVIDDVGILLPGEMEVGKTTLVTGLLRSGADYLSDEAIGISPEEDAMQGYPKALSLDPGSWPLFPELEPDPPEPVRAFLPQQWQVRASSLPGVRIRHRATPGLVVFPRYRPGADPHVRRLHGAEAIMRLSACVFPTAMVQRRVLKRLARLLCHARCHELTYDGIEPGVAAIYELVAGYPPLRGTWSGQVVRRSDDAPQLQDRQGTSARTRLEARRLDGPRRTICETDRLLPRPDALVIDVGDEFVVHVAENDELHSLDPLGAQLWSSLDGEQSVGHLIDELATASGGDRDAIAASVIGFVESLVSLELLRWRDQTVVTPCVD